MGVANLGGGMPLFKDFTQDDWVLMGLRYELHLLSHAFRKDVNDDERAGINLDHFQFYYSKYFKKGINARDFGVASLAELIELVGDTVCISEDKAVLESLLSDEWESDQVFV